LKPFLITNQQSTKLASPKSRAQGRPVISVPLIPSVHVEKRHASLPRGVRPTLSGVASRRA